MVSSKTIQHAVRALANLDTCPCTHIRKKEEKKKTAKNRKNNNPKYLTCNHYSGKALFPKGIITKITQKETLIHVLDWWTP